MVAGLAFAAAVGANACRGEAAAGPPRQEWDVGNAGSVLSFREDAKRELYVLSANGRVYRLDLR